MTDHILTAPDDVGAGTEAEEILEVPLLLPGWQVTALERAAHNRGLTAGEMVRQVLRDFIDGKTMPTRPVKASKLTL